MNDDQLQSELERRAGTVSPRPEWTRRDLLPAMWREIDARPQPVIASRWSPLAGLATLVVALLVMVVAVPRLAPGPLTTPEPTFPVLTTADFAARLAAGELNGRTALVSGRISTPGDDFVPKCPPGGGDVYVSCGVLLILEGTEIGIYARPLAVTHADYPAGAVLGPTSWPWWDSSWALGAGVLLLKVPSDGGSVEFLGRVRGSGQGLTWAVVDAKALDINSIGLDEVVLVDGWLGGFTYVRCADIGSPRVDGLPSRHCSYEWIASGSNPEELPRVQVQPGAYSEFAPNPTTQGDRESRRGVYAIAPRLEGWCPNGDPPCWQWNVVGRVDAAPTPSPSVSPSPTASPTTIECVGDALPITVFDSTGLVTACRPLHIADSEGVSQQPTVTNPDGDTSRLRVTWGTSGCVRGARVSLSENGHSIAITQYEIVPGCFGPLVFVGFELDVRTEVDASTVSVTFAEPEPTPAATTIPTPMPSPTVAGVLFDCPPTWRTDPEMPLAQLHPTVVDHTGLVRTCTKPEKPMLNWNDNRALSIGNPDGDLTALQIEWDGDPCGAAVEFSLSRAEDGYSLEGRSTYTGQFCILPRVIHTIRLELNGQVDSSSVAFSWEGQNNEPAPSPTPSPEPTPSDKGSREFHCTGSEALGDPGISLVDHSGRIAGCSMATADETPEGAIGVVTTHLPLQLAVDWTVNSGCPADETMEFWGPTDQPLGLANYVVQLARRQIPGQQCNDLVAVRRVELGFTEPIKPSDILPLIVDESTSGSSVSHAASATTGAGRFTLLLSGALDGHAANAPIDIAPELTYEGEEIVTLSGLWRPDFTFDSLSGGPSFDAYGHILLCPQNEAQLSSGDSVTGKLPHPPSPADGDPNYAYFNEFSPDGLFRLPAGTYLIRVGVSFNVGSDCRGESVNLRASIVIHVR